MFPPNMVPHPPSKPSPKVLSLKVFMPTPHFQIYYSEKHQYTNSHVSVTPTTLYPDHLLLFWKKAFCMLNRVYYIKLDHWEIIIWRNQNPKVILYLHFLFKIFTFQAFGSMFFWELFRFFFILIKSFAYQIRHLRSTARPHHLQPLPLGVQPPGHCHKHDPISSYKVFTNPTNSDGSVRRVELRHKRAWYSSGELRLKSENAILASITR